MRYARIIATARRALYHTLSRKVCAHCGGRMEMRGFRMECTDQICNLVQGTLAEMDASGDATVPAFEINL